MVGERWGISGEVQTARVAEGGGADEEEHGEEIHAELRNSTDLADISV